MDATLAIDHNLEALKRIMATLFAMAGFTAREQPQEGALPQASTLRRHLYLAVLRLLRPAESAARRLIVTLGMSLPAPAPVKPRPAPRHPKPTPTILRNGVGTGIIMPAGALPPSPPLTRLAFPLFDRLNVPRYRHPPSRATPRISVLGFNRPSPVVARQPISPDDPVDAARLKLRLAALARVLDDLPCEARRFARWHSRLQPPATARRPHRIWPLKPGRPPGATARAKEREIDEVLNAAHALAIFSLERHDTS